jgi:hypothetical protein
MKAKFAVICLAAIAAACAPLPSQAPSPPPPESEADAGPPPRELQEGKPLPPVDVRRLKCSMLNSATDDDKAYAATFLLGYRSALLHSHILDTKRIDAVEQAAMADCASHPNEIATRVFAVALFKVERAERLEKAAERADKAAQTAAEKAGMTPPMQFRRRAIVPNPAPAEQQPAAATGQDQPAATPPSDQSHKE